MKLLRPPGSSASHSLALSLSVAVIDGKYEVLSQVSLGEGQTLLNATAPDGTALNIVWLELTTPQQEAQFERYRQALRALKRAGLGALHDIVARPGATYVAWQVPASRKRVVANQVITTLLAEYGYSTEQADVRSDGGAQRVYGLSYEGEALPDPLVPPLPAANRPATFTYKGLWERARAVPTWALPWGLGIGLSLLGILFFYLSFTATFTNDLVRLPTLIGQHANAAARRLYTEHLAVSLEPVPSERPPFEVVDSDPPAGSTLRPGQRVRLRYALPPDQVALTEVPELTGLALTTEIQTLLEASGLRLGEVAYLHSPVKNDFIIAQSRPPASQLEEGSRVDILVSQGLEGETTFVPDLTGLPFEEAQALGSLAGVRVLEPNERPSSRYPSGTVIAQNLPPFTPVNLQDADLRLSVAGRAEASPTRPLPSLIGLSRDGALRVAQEAGYTLRFASVEDPLESLNLPEGVVNQTLVEGQDSVLNILYNVHPNFIPRPEVSIQVMGSEPRGVPYNFYVEPNIPPLQARVTAKTLAGETFEVLRAASVRGGDSITGVWETVEPGPITFYLYLGSGTQPYAGATVNP